MTQRKHVVRVRIMGEEYSIRSEADPEHTRRVAEYLDAAIRGVMRAGAAVESQRAAILAALQITDELFRARERGESADEAMRKLSGEVKRLLPPAKRESTLADGD